MPQTIQLGLFYSLSISQLHFLVSSSDSTYMRFSSHDPEDGCQYPKLSLAGLDGQSRMMFPTESQTRDQEKYNARVAQS